jgi:hypothetical protein
MVQVECMATKGYVAFICMPLLTELVSTEDGFCYCQRGVKPSHQWANQTQPF